MLSACRADAPSVTWLTLDFPHGGLRLVVQRDNETRWFYAALPTHRAVRDGTFDIDDLYQQLEPRLHEVVPTEDQPNPDQPYGMVTLAFGENSQQDYLIYDEAFALELFKTACANLVDQVDFGTEIFIAECTNISTTPR
jgi:hypothetical protein